jgi:hypothetical protein
MAAMDQSENAFCNPTGSQTNPRERGKQSSVAVLSRERIKL